MKKIAIHARHRNHYLRRQLQLDLFAWRPTPPWHDNRAALLIAKRFGLSVDHASTVARLAGIGDVTGRPLRGPDQVGRAMQVGAHHEA